MLFASNSGLNIHEQRAVLVEGVQDISEPSVHINLQQRSLFPGRLISLLRLDHTPHAHVMHVDNAAFGLFGVCIFWSPVSGEHTCEDSTIIDCAEGRSAVTRFATFWRTNF